MWAQAVAGLLLLAIVIGPFLPADDEDDVATTSTTTTTTTVEVPAAEAEKVPTTASTTTTTTTSSPAGKITGFGASRKAWDSAHDQADGYSKGAAYAPMLEGGQPQYAAVCCEDQILSYTLNMPYGVTLDATQQRVRQEFPADATPGPLVDLGECSTQEWRSSTVEAAVDDPYIPLVAYFPPDPNYPKDEQRWSAIFTITKPGEENSC